MHIDYSSTMQFHHLLRILIVLSLAACSSQPQLAQLPPGSTVLAFGDSLTYGTGAKAEQSYPAVLERLSGLTVVNAGVPGEVTAAGLKRLPRLLDETQPALLLLCHGGNDMLRKQDPALTINNLRQMIRMARTRDVEIVLVGVPRPGLLLGTAKFYRQVATETHVPLEEEALADILSQRNLKSDHVHPNAEGYRQLAHKIYEFLQESGAI